MLKIACRRCLSRKFQFEHLAAKTERIGELMRLDSLQAKVYKLMLDFSGNARKQHTFEAPIGQKNQLLVGRDLVGQFVSKKPFGLKVRFYPAELAGEEPIGFF